MAVQRARIERKSAPLNSDFGREFLTRRFGERDAALIYSLLPAYSRGPRKGLLKGFIHWDKVVEGGWCHDRDGKGHVERPGTRNVRVCASYDADVSISISEHRRYEGETDEQREAYIRELLSLMFGKRNSLRGIVPADLPQRACA